MNGPGQAGNQNFEPQVVESLDIFKHFTAVQMEALGLCIHAGKSHQTRTVPSISTHTIPYSNWVSVSLQHLLVCLLCALRIHDLLSSERVLLLDVCMLLIRRKLPTEVLAGQAAGTALHLALGLTAFAHSLPAPSPSTFFSHSVSALAGQGGPPDGVTQIPKLWSPCILLRL